MLGSHLLKSWSATHKIVTLSSAEADLVAAVKVCGECIGITQLANDWGIELCGEGAHRLFCCDWCSEPPGQREASQLCGYKGASRMERLR